MRYAQILKLSFRATKNPFYLHVGRDILYNLNNHTKAVCGYATVHDVQVSTFKAECCVL